ncbi:hypothetical protein EUX98_g8820 [Antrodiella citrinella]|uniref:Uncharacterized protein n=1 Tax=Antrodiella citrinella TaxID=2447956 RepID=A0A4S4M4L8_9APHY|nr:hypothetical protein EUX98_g8820 [Antrodiella citrinella]
MNPDTTQSTNETSPPNTEEAKSIIFARLQNAVNYKPPSDTPSEATNEAMDTLQGNEVAASKSQPTVVERFLSAMYLKPRDSRIEFPPAHWKDEPNSTPSPDQTPTTNTGDSEPLDTNDEGPEFEDNIPPAQAPDPESFANRIHALIATLPPIFSSNPASSSTAGSGDSIAPNMIRDPKMISFLSSPSVMNGSASSGRQSVWTVLDRLKGRLPAPVENKGTETDSVPLEETGREGLGKEKEESDDDSSSIMLYGPLLPGVDSEVEVAESELVQEDEGTAPNDSKSEEKEKPPGVWLFRKRKAPDEQKKDGRVHVRDTKNKRVWVPSDTKISLEIMWWGYRLYLPPLVLEMLSNKQLEGAKRAAMITTALKWLLDHVPALMVPPNMRPALKLLKGLVPYLGYIGGLVAWSWGYIKKFDKGNGVTLTATWLATVVLVPGTWEDSNSPKSAPTDTRRKSNDATPSSALDTDAADFSRKSTEATA